MTSPHLPTPSPFGGEGESRDASRSQQPAASTQHPGAESPSEPWRVLQTEYLLHSPWRNVRTDRVALHTGEQITYTYLETPDAAFVVPLMVDGRIALIRQYRHPVRAWLWEIPAGSFSAESPLEAARRELTEEIGGTCREVVSVGKFRAASSHVTHWSHVFLALDVELGETSHESTELIEVVLMDADEVFERARDGRVDDSQSALALLMAEPRVRAYLAERESSRHAG